ncbi:MAG TPA: hypothetical protein VHU90_03570 [Galbitalea sp.]|nr:hypothetical protein [Galbitalea sp.]
MTWEPTGPFDSELAARAAAKRWSDPTAGLDRETAYDMGHQPELYRAGMRDVRKQRLREALQRTGIETGEYDDELPMWVDGWESASVEVLASLIERAYEAGVRDAGKGP